MTETKLKDQREGINELRLSVKEINNTKEACDFLRVAPITLWRERRAGRISFHRISSKIVYTREDLENYLARNKRAAFAVEK
jgi:hypothetical protein